MSNLSVFCLLLCARTRLEVELHLTYRTKFKLIAELAGCSQHLTRERGDKVCLNYAVFMEWPQGLCPRLYLHDGNLPMYER